MNAKLQTTKEMIARLLKAYRNPAIMWSSGKDSMVLLHIVHHDMGVRLPVIFHRTPFQARRYEFADSLIRNWHLDVYDWPPSETMITKANGQLSLIEMHTIGGGLHCALPVDLYEPEIFAEGQYVCGLKDIYSRPKGAFAYPWDMVLHGHKSSDVDPLYGAVPLHVDVKQNANAAHAGFPLREWTDDDIWEYIHTQDVPFQEDRYRRLKGNVRDDHRNSPDWLAGCTRCMDADGAKEVFCPKLGMQVGNIGAQLKPAPAALATYYGEKGVEREL